MYKDRFALEKKGTDDPYGWSFSSYGAARLRRSQKRAKNVFHRSQIQNSMCYVMGTGSIWDIASLIQRKNERFAPLALATKTA